MNHSRYDEKIKNAKSNVPDGRYDCIIEDFKDGKTQKGLDRISAYLKILAGDHKGRMLFKNWILMDDLSDEAFGFIRADFEKLGFDFQKMNFGECVARLNSKIGGKITVEQKTNDKGYTNVYLKDKLVMSDYSNIEYVPDGTEDDNVPF